MEGCWISLRPKMFEVALVVYVSKQNDLFRISQSQSDVYKTTGSLHADNTLLRSHNYT